MNEFQIVRRKVPAVLAAQWFKNGDHPEDGSIVIRGEGVESFLSEGQIVRYFRHPNVSGDAVCPECKNRMHEHGWIGQARCNIPGGMKVCPGDWIVHYPAPRLHACNPAQFVEAFQADASGMNPGEAYEHGRREQERLSEDALKGLRQAKDSAYHERDRLVAALSKCFPSFLARHPAGDAWEDDWRNIVFVMMPTGQASWHIHDSELPLFSHLLMTSSIQWDGHTTEEKYQRLEALQSGSIFHAAMTAAVRKGGELA